MTAKLCFIPEKLKVGYQKRDDTFTGKLSYIIYVDSKGVLRKEKSWTGWCDSSIPKDDYDNKPMNGFVINKGVTRSNEWFGSGRTMVRIHDPRGFEFEITHDNLIAILSHSDVSKREIVEPCTYAWFGTELVLLPTNSEAYTLSTEFTDNQVLKITSKELGLGSVYGIKSDLTSKKVYIGRYNWYEWVWQRGTDSTYMRVNKGKKYVFFDLDSNSFEHLAIDKLSSLISTNYDTYSELVQQWIEQSIHSQDVDVNNCIVHTKGLELIEKSQHYNYRVGSKKFVLRGQKLIGNDLFTICVNLHVCNDIWYVDTKFLLNDSITKGTFDRSNPKGIQISREYRYSIRIEEKYRYNTSSYQKTNDQHMEDHHLRCDSPLITTEHRNNYQQMLNMFKQHVLFEQDVDNPYHRKQIISLDKVKEILASGGFDNQYDLVSLNNININTGAFSK